MVSVTAQRSESEGTFCFPPQICWRWRLCQIRYWSDVHVWSYLWVLPLSKKASSVCERRPFSDIKYLSMLLISQRLVGYLIFCPLSERVLLCIQQILVGWFSFMCTDPEREGWLHLFICYAAHQHKVTRLIKDGSIGQDTVKPGDNEATLSEPHCVSVHGWGSFRACFTLSWILKFS